MLPTNGVSLNGDAPDDPRYEDPNLRVLCRCGSSLPGFDGVSALQYVPAAGRGVMHPASSVLPLVAEDFKYMYDKAEGTFFEDVAAGGSLGKRRVIDPQLCTLRSKRPQHDPTDPTKDGTYFPDGIYLHPALSDISPSMQGARAQALMVLQRLQRLVDSFVPCADPGAASGGAVSGVGVHPPPGAASTRPKKQMRAQVLASPVAAASLTRHPTSCWK